jgi:squalene-hopene/tetraprenyl-beta-curcumene cyclase
MESDDHFGATMALLGVGAAPEDYRETPEARAGVERLKKYLAANPPPTLHHKLMLLWADSYLAGVVSAEQKSEWLAELTKLQHADGGFSLASFGDWERADDTPQDTVTSDGYATGLAIVILRRSGVAADDQRIARGSRPTSAKAAAGSRAPSTRTASTTSATPAPPWPCWR